VCVEVVTGNTFFKNQYLEAKRISALGRCTRIERAPPDEEYKQQVTTLWKGCGQRSTKRRSHHPQVAAGGQIRSGCRHPGYDNLHTARIVLWYHAP